MAFLGCVVFVMASIQLTLFFVRGSTLLGRKEYTINNNLWSTALIFVQVYSLRSKKNVILALNLDNGESSNIIVLLSNLHVILAFLNIYFLLCI
jgi:hypothetical protein